MPQFSHSRQQGGHVPCKMPLHNAPGSCRSFRVRRFCFVFFFSFFCFLLFLFSFLSPRCPFFDLLPPPVASRTALPCPPRPFNCWASPVPQAARHRTLNVVVTLGILPHSGSRRTKWRKRDNIHLKAQRIEISGAQGNGEALETRGHFPTSSHQTPCLRPCPLSPVSCHLAPHSPPLLAITTEHLTLLRAATWHLLGLGCRPPFWLVSTLRSVPRRWDSTRARRRRR